jgi:hypothetical protein
MAKDQAAWAAVLGLVQAVSTDQDSAQRFLDFLESESHALVDQEENHTALGLLGMKANTGKTAPSKHLCMKYHDENACS